MDQISCLPLSSLPNHTLGAIAQLPAQIAFGNTTVPQIIGPGHATATVCRASLE